MDIYIRTPKSSFILVDISSTFFHMYFRVMYFRVMYSMKGRPEPTGTNNVTMDIAACTDPHLHALHCITSSPSFTHRLAANWFGCTATARSCIQRADCGLNPSKTLFVRLHIVHVSHKALVSSPKTIPPHSAPQRRFRPSRHGAGSFQCRPSDSRHSACTGCLQF